MTHTAQDWAKRGPHPFPPPWANAWGDDRYGLWADFGLGEVVQRMRWVEAGSFLMGSPEEEPYRQEREGPRHLVQITQGFWLADTACTQALYQQVIGSNPSSFHADAGGGPDHPVESVSFNDIVNFLRRLQAQLPGSLPTLPTEAQWEYACRADTRTAYSFGDKISGKLANVDSKATVAVRHTAYAPNPWGLWQMHGNVWEWCGDALRDYAKPCDPDPGLGEARGLQAGDKAEPNAARRVLRGGSWFSTGPGARSAYRSRDPGVRRVRDYAGFRFVLRSE